jgi:hypothetical protein
MLPGIMAGVSAATNIGFGVYDRYKNNKQQDWSNAFDREQFDYMKGQNALTQEREDNAHQREVEDLRAAGLNPMLSGMGGQGSESSTAATAGDSSNMGQMGPIPDTGGLLQGVMGESQAKLQREQGKNLAADTLNKELEGGLITSQKAKTKAEEEKAKAETNAINEKLEAEIEKLRADTALTNENRRLAIINGLKQAIVDIGELTSSSRLNRAAGVGGDKNILPFRAGFDINDEETWSRSEKAVIYDIADEILNKTMTAQQATEELQRRLSNINNRNDNEPRETNVPQGDQGNRGGNMGTRDELNQGTGFKFK